MYFSMLKDKQQKAYRLKSNDDMLLNYIAPMFTYDGFPETVDTRFIDIYRLLNGACAFWKHEGKWIVTEVDFGGTPDVYGMGTIAFCRTKNGVVKEFNNWRESDEIVVMFNNSIMCPDMLIGKTSDMLTEVETSLDFNVMFSRLYPIPVAKNGTIKKAIEEVMNNMEAGKYKTILSEEAIAKYLENQATVDIINLTDVKNSDKIQYLSHYRDDLVRWFLSNYGMNSQGTAKMAQQTVDEVNQDSNASMIIPHDRYHEALKAVEQLNTKFGWNCSVAFSECWQGRLAQCLDEETTEETIEDTNDVEVEEQEGDNNGEDE